jgi:transcriptional regulator with XRE-family HTH domain
VDASELGRRLRAERTAGGRTIASVAAAAGLSVPYIANLENGRGNPTVAALTRLAEALGLHLDVHLAPETDGRPDPTPEPATEILRFARTARFQDEAVRMARRTGVPEQTARQRLLALLVAAGAAAGGELSTMDCHRFLDALALADLDASRSTGG